jgi:hypothetical protein
MASAGVDNQKAVASARFLYNGFVSVFKEF